MTELRERYFAAARAWIASDDAELAIAVYELGSRAYREQVALGELLAIHHVVVAELVGESKAPDATVRKLAPLLDELIAPFTHEVTQLRAQQTTHETLTGRLRQQREVLDRANEVLRVARAEAEAAARAKAEFLAHMSHEIRTPLNAVIGMSALLLDTRLDDLQQDYARTLNTSAEHLLTIINDILDFSKVDSGNVELELVPFELAACVEQALDLVAVRAADKGLDVAYYIEPGTPELIRSDVGRLRQVLLNLLSNAVKFTARGEVVVSVSARPLDPPSHELQIAVRDSGPGIAPEVQPRLFKPFSQGDASTTRIYGGTGLGLSISARLVELLGGRIWHESSPRGATFVFTVRADAVAAERGDAAHAALRGRRMLIVDDNPTNRQILRAYATTWQMDALEADSASRALALLATGERVDLAIVDYELPGMSGVELADRVHGLPGREHLPLVMLSSVSVPRNPATTAGFHAYLMKPIKPAPLYEVVAQIVSGDRTAASAPRAEDIPASELGKRHPLRILVAEDNPVNQKVARAMLAKFGFTPSVVANGREAVDAIAAYEFDLVLMDVQMPEMDGLEASRILVATYEPHARPRIIAMTANATDEDRRACLASGMDGHVSKPITGSKLEEIIKTSTRRATLARARAAVERPPPELAMPAARQRASTASPIALDLIDIVVGELGASALAFRRAVDRGDPARTRDAARALAELATRHGFERLAGECNELSARTDGELRADTVAAAARIQVQVEAAQTELQPGRKRVVSRPIPLASLGELVARGELAERDRVDLFVKVSTALADALHRAIDRGDLPALVAAASELRTAAATVAAVELVHTAEILEAAVAAHEHDALAGLLAAVDIELRRVHDALHSAR